MHIIKLKNNYFQYPIVLNYFQTIPPVDFALPNGDRVTFKMLVSIYDAILPLISLLIRSEFLIFVDYGRVREKAKLRNHGNICHSSK